MLNKIWPSMIIASILYGIFCGRIGEVNDAIYISLEETINLCLNFLGIMCFWNGMIAILKNTKIIEKLKKLLRPIIDKFFNGETEKSKEYISLNIISNIIGIGNAATPMGIKAMEEMNKENNKKNLSKSMNLFVLLNTLSIQLIPTTVISTRATFGSENAGKIILPIWIVSVLSLLIVMFIGLNVFKEDEKDEYI